MYAWRKCTLFCVKKVCGMFAGLRKISTFASAIAEIAQLVEHNLAKVRVASSNPSAPAIDYPENPEKSGFFVTFLRERFLGDRG